MADKAEENGGRLDAKRTQPRLKSRLTIAPAYGSAVASELMRAIAEAQAGSGDIVWGSADTDGGIDRG